MTVEYIAGRNPVNAALSSDRDINKIFIAESARRGQLQQIIQQATAKKVTIQYVPNRRLNQLFKGNHQGVIAQVAAYRYFDLDHLFSIAEKRQEEPFFIILDEIEDPHNLGSILRTADASGVHGIIIPRRRAVGLTPAVAKASTGAIEHIPVVRVTNIVRTIEQLKERGVWIVGTDAQTSADYRTIDGKLPLGIVIGSEGKGIGRLIKEKCDFLVHLPMVGKLTSLNASVAAAILMYEVFRHRQPNGG